MVWSSRYNMWFYYYFFIAIPVCIAMVTLSSALFFFYLCLPNIFSTRSLPWFSLLSIVLFNCFLSSPPADVISTVEFNQTGDLLATGDKGGRVVIFQRETEVSLQCKNPHFLKPSTAATDTYCTVISTRTVNAC